MKDYHDLTASMSRKFNFIWRESKLFFLCLSQLCHLYKEGGEWPGRGQIVSGRVSAVFFCLKRRQQDRVCLVCTDLTRKHFENVSSVRTMLSSACAAKGNSRCFTEKVPGEDYVTVNIIVLLRACLPPQHRRAMFVVCLCLFHLGSRVSCVCKKSYAFW